MPHIDCTNTIQQVFPYLIVRDCPAAIEFCKRVFGAEEVMRLAEPSGHIGHAELKLGAAIIMLAEEHPDRGVLKVKEFENAINNHAKFITELQDKKTSLF